ncbi:hypothetical protein ACFQGU_01540 [Longivirga aurantiaca]|uniref:Uncharacterized protein n=1 Tax=Longivirga aurantiaca TaxID=1837743 RepID=A0ABW1SWX4_9ACTN
MRILLALAGGLALGRLLPSVLGALDAVKIGQTSLPIALGLLLMMYPVLAKVQGEAITSDPLAVVSIAVPLLVYFAIMWGSRSSSDPGRG